MTITIPSVTIHVHVTDPQAAQRHAELTRLLKQILGQGVSIMASAAELNAKLDEANTTTNEIAADIADIQAQLAGGVSAADAAALQERLAAHVETLKGVANLQPPTA